MDTRNTEKTHTFDAFLESAQIAVRKQRNCLQVLKQ